MAGTAKKRLKHNEYTVAIICPLEVEMSAVRYMLDDEHARLPSKDGDSNRYIFGEMSGHNVVVGFLPDGSQGIGTAATMATDMRRTFPAIQLRLLVGIGGGVPSHANDVRLGDVVVGTPSGKNGGVVQYDLGKETITGFERKGFLEPPPKPWREAIVEMKSDHRTEKNRIPDFLSEMAHKYPRLKEEYTSLGSKKDLLFPPDSTHVLGEVTCEKCDRTRVIRRNPRPEDTPNIHYGLIASGDRVMKNGEMRDRISKDAGGALCFEMEAAGLVNDFQCIVIRGIADYADSHKNDDWHAYAAATAAGCAKELLTYMEPVKGTKPAEYSTIPKHKVKELLGREDELEQITTFFSSSPIAKPRILSLYALGGQGKSQIALEYCGRMNGIYRGLFWINATSDSTLRQSLFNTVQVLDPSVAPSSQGNELARWLHQALAVWDERWLMVFDNCDDPLMFPRILDLIPPAGKGDVLFTTRHRGLERLGEVLSVPPLSSKAGVKLLLRDFKNVNLDAYILQASQIVDRLGGLALAIDQAAAYIQDRQWPIEHLGNFLEMYEKKRKEVLKHTPEDFWEYQALHIERAAQEGAVSAFTTWEMSFQHLCQAEAEKSVPVGHFFSVCAFLAPTGVSEMLFRRRWEDIPRPPWIEIFTTKNSSYYEEDNPSAWSHGDFWRLLCKANRLSLIQSMSPGTESDGATFSYHPLIRDWLQLRVGSQERQRLIEESVKTIVSSIDVIQDRGANANVRQSLLLHVDACLRNDREFSKEGHRLGEDINNCSLAHSFAKFYRDLGRYKSSITLHSVVLETRRAALGDEYPSTLSTRRGLARALREDGRYDESEKIYRELVSIDERLLGREHIDTAVTINGLAKILQIRGKYEEAETILRPVVEIHSRLLGAEHPELIATTSNLAASLGGQGKYEEAEGMFREVLALSQKILGFEHVDTLKDMRSLADVLEKQGKWKDAEKLSREVHALREKILGAEHPKTISTLGDVANVLRKQGKFEDAEEIYREVLALRRRVIGPEHPSTMRAMGWLADTLFERQQVAEAAKIDQELLELYQKVLGDHNDTVEALKNLAQDMKHLTKYDQAAELTVEALEMSLRVSGRDHTRTSYLVGSLRRLWVREGLRDPEIITKFEAMFGLRTALVGAEFKIVNGETSA